MFAPFVFLFHALTLYHAKVAGRIVKKITQKKELTKSLKYVII